MLGTTLMVLVLLLSLGRAGADAVGAQPVRALPAEAAQVLFLVDESSSMTELARDPAQPTASRWEILRQMYPQWLARLDPEVLVGVSSVGGACGAPPALNLPVGTDRTQVATALDTMRPNGATNLNAALLAAPPRFASGVRGSKRIVLLSDGLNTCAPRGSTCAIARDLHRTHGITIDVVAWLTEPGMLEEFKCLTEATAGTFTAPRSLDEWRQIPLPGFDLWRYVVLGLGSATVFLASLVLYRHGFHVLRWGTGQATLAAGLLLGLGVLSLYLVLCVRAGLGAALLGGAVLAGVLAVVGRREQPATAAAPHRTLWAALGWVVCAATLVPSLAGAAAVPAGACRVQGPPRYHHVLALDVSGSVAPHLGQMKAFLTSYAERCPRAGEEVSLLVFGSDAAGTVRELQTFTVPTSGATTALTAWLDTLQVQPPTRTYFRPLADYLSQFLLQVRLDPVLLVVSDGKSDARQDQVPFEEIAFESFGKRGVYRVPGMAPWKVAIQGGNDLDLAALFHKPLSVRSAPAAPPLSAPRRPVLDPCLFEPAFLVETDPRVVLRPRWWPWSQVVDGTLTLRVRHECVTRVRSFAVEVPQGGAAWHLGQVTQAPIGPTPQAVALPITRPARGGGVTDAVVHILLDQGGSTRTVYPQQPPRVIFEEVAYWAAYGWTWGLVGVVLLSLGGGGVWLVCRRRDQERDRPEIIKILGGRAVALRLGQTSILGGEGCQLVVPGVPPGVTLARATWTGVRGELLLSPEPGVSLQVNGSAIDGREVYRLGQPLVLLHPAEGMTYQVTLHAGAPADLGRGAVTRVRSRRGRWTGAFPSRAGDALAASNGAYRAAAGPAGGPARTPDTYI